MTDWTSGKMGPRDPETGDLVASHNNPAEKHMVGTIREHYFHPREGMPGVCEKCCDETERAVKESVSMTVSGLGGATLDKPYVRVFWSGATRDTDDGKFDYEAFLSPLVLRRYAEYMHKNRVQRDGSLRDGDNWQKGMGLPVFMKSAWRHFVDWWREHRGEVTTPTGRDGTEEAICAVLFNAMGYLHETLKARGY